MDHLFQGLAKLLIYQSRKEALGTQDTEGLPSFHSSAHFCQQFHWAVPTSSLYTHSRGSGCLLVPLFGTLAINLLSALLFLILSFFAPRIALLYS